MKSSLSQEHPGGRVDVKAECPCRRGGSRARCVSQLGDVSSYTILSGSGVTTLDGVDDAERFKAIQEAFSTVGVDSDSQMQVTRQRSEHRGPRVRVCSFALAGSWRLPRVPRRRCIRIRLLCHPLGLNQHVQSWPPAHVLIVRRCGV